MWNHLQYWDLKQNVSSIGRKTYSVFAEEMLVDKVQQLTLNVPEMIVLIDGLGVSSANYIKFKQVAFTDQV